MIIRAVLFLAAVSGLLAPMTVAAQSGRLWGTSTMQYVEVRPLVVDSVLQSEVPGDGLLRPIPGGGVVRCVTGEDYCRYGRSDDPVHTVPMIHDVSGTAWGFAEGVRLYTRFILRGEVAGQEGIWPRAGDTFDLVLAYLEWNRRALRVRAGRQWKVSGLGFHNYDGASVSVRPVGSLQAEVYGGWSLARGLNEPRTGDALAAIESFAPAKRALIFGTGVTYRPSARGAITGLYQRELRTDRKGLYSERVAVDGFFRTGRATLEGTFDADLPSRTVNEARLRARAVLPGGFGAVTWLRRYQPFFELWTIWGAFTPVAFSEVGLGGSWRALDGSVGVDVNGSWRSYGETNTSPVFGTARSTAWRLVSSVTAQLTPSFSIAGRYGTDVSFGSAKNSGGLRLQQSLGSDSYVGASLEAFQTAYEFRVDEGTVLGLGVDGGMGFGSRTLLRGGITTYSHRNGGQSPETDWSQIRAYLHFEWSVGAEAGMARPGRLR